ncbi:hypothetical protein D3C73_854190 [compost metagenome]
MNDAAMRLIFIALIQAIHKLLYNSSIQAIGMPGITPVLVNNYLIRADEKLFLQGKLSCPIRFSDLLHPIHLFTDPHEQINFNTSQLFYLSFQLP